MSVGGEFISPAASEVVDGRGLLPGGVSSGTLTQGIIFTLNNLKSIIISL